MSNIISRREIQCGECEGKGSVLQLVLSAYISSTASYYNKVKCCKCKGTGKLIEETTTRILRNDSTLVE